MSIAFELIVPGVLAAAGLTMIVRESRRLRRLHRRVPDLPAELERRATYHRSLLFVSTGASLTSLGLLLLQLAPVWCTGLGTLSFVLGLQALLAGLGVRHEILGNSWEPTPRLGTLRAARTRNVEADLPTEPGAPQAQGEDEVTLFAIPNRLLSPPPTDPVHRGTVADNRLNSA